MTLVLLVHDAQQVNDHGVCCLQTAGYQVKTCTFEAALDTTVALLPDLILVRWHTGRECLIFFQALQKHPETQVIPRVVMRKTPVGTGANVEEPGADDYLEPSATCDEICRIIRWRLLRYHQFRAELEEQLSWYEMRDAQERQLWQLFSHDLRGVFAGWVGAMELVLSQIQESTLTPLLHLLAHSAQASAHLLEQMLTYLRRSPQDLLLEAQALNLRSLVERVCDVLAYQFKLRDLQVHLDISDALMVYVDPQVLFSVVHNVLDNACKVTPTGGTVRCEVEQTEHYCIVKIQDQGPGFELASSAASSEPRYGDVSRGLGIGLWLSEDLLHKMGGKLLRESIVEQGGCVSLWIPRKAMVSSFQT